MEVIIRNWQRKDFAEIYNLLHDSWFSAYKSFIPESDLLKYLDTTYNTDKLEQLFVNKDVICFVAEINTQTAGWLKLTISEQEKRFYLGSLYVSPHYQNLKLGNKLMELAFSTAKEHGFSEIWIGVIEQNEFALNWYKKLGFQFSEKQPFKMGNTEVPHLIGSKKLL